MSVKLFFSKISTDFKRYLQDESGLNRRHIVDNRVHCCFYFINPCGHGLRPIDIEFMKTLQTRVNLVPLISKADMLTPKEIKKFKKRILDELAKHQIRIYQVNSNYSVYRQLRDSNSQ